ncbi:MAG: hypothetical protein IJ622_04950 [Bacteroidales bacterium]|nr:hypothetical protein [Bacteroidales bacterium]
MKYLRLIPALLLGVMLTACNTTKKLYEAQQYDEVIQRVAPDICAGDMNAKHINYVAASYHKANQADHERIQALKATGQPDAWPEIYQRYCSMKGRNEALACFPREVKQGMNYVKLDLNDDMMAARNHAEAFLVAKANQLLNTGSKADAEEADKFIEQLQRTNQENSNLPQLKKKSLMCQTDRVFVTIYNDDERPLGDGFANAVLSFDEGEVPANVTNLAKRHTRLSVKDAEVRVAISDVQITPNRLDEVTFKETNGGKTVEVTDHSQNKAVTVTGTLKYYDAYGYRALAVVPFEVKSTFKNDYTTIKGDREACSAETLSRLNSQPVPVPTDESMLLDAAKKLNDLIATELKK